MFAAKALASYFKRCDYSQTTQTIRSIIQHCRCRVWLLTRAHFRQIFLNGRAHVWCVCFDFSIPIFLRVTTNHPMLAANQRKNEVCSPLFYEGWNFSWGHQGDSFSGLSFPTQSILDHQSSLCALESTTVQTVHLRSFLSPSIQISLCHKDCVLLNISLWVFH